MQHEEPPLRFGKEVSYQLTSTTPRTVLVAGAGLALGILGFLVCLLLMALPGQPNLWFFPAAFGCVAFGIGWVFFILHREKNQAQPAQTPVIQTQTRRRWLPWAILGGVALVGLVAFIISLGPINRLCRGMIEATASLPETISVSSCHSEVTSASSTRLFTAQTTLAEVTAFMAAYGLPADPTQTTGDFTMSWNRPGERVQVSWQGGTLRYEQTLSDSLN